MRISFIKLSVAIFSLIAFGFLGCSGPGSNNAPGPIKVGVILPLTGRLAQMGEIERNAMSLAAEDVNKSGKRIELVIEDGKGQPNEAITSARKLLDVDRVDLLITSTTGASLAVEPIATGGQTNLVAFCMDPDVAKKSDYTLRYYQGINEESRGILEYFGNADATTKVGILYARVPVWDKAVNEIYLPYFKDKKLDVAFNESYDLNETDFRNIILKLKSSGANRLILLGYGFEYGSIFKSLEEQSLLHQIQIVGGWGFLYTGLSKDQLEGIVVSGPNYVFSTADKDDAFVKAYTQKYGSPPNFDAAFAYTAIMGIASTVTHDNVRKPIKALLKNQSKLPGVVGEYSFNGDGEMITQFGLGVYRNGSLVKY